MLINCLKGVSKLKTTMKTKYNYVVFLPYFGKLPAMFDLWSQSCGYNSQFLFVVFTNDTYAGTLPENVRIKQMSFREMQSLVQSKFNFPISLESPYKLCDYKPAFGYIFQDYLEKCSYWGCCDMDLVFGDIAQFLPQQNYDKISHLGHLCLYRNLPEINKAFMLKSTHPINYKDIFSSNVHFAFDEDYDFGINAIFRTNNLTVYPFENHIADVSSRRHNFTISHYQNPGYTWEMGDRIFSFEEGHVYAHTCNLTKIEVQEYAYVHIQKRRLVRQFTGEATKYLITPMGFKSWEPVTPTLIQSCQEETSLWKQWTRKLSVKRTSFPRALRRKWAVAKIKGLANLKNKGKIL